MATKQAVNGRFSKPKGCFSQISNEVLRDPSLSLKAKGLYSLIVSYITLPGFTLYKGYLQSQCAEGRYSFDSTWKELVAAGYLSHQRVRQPDGTFAYEYTLSGKENIETELPQQVVDVSSVSSSSKQSSLSVDSPQPVSKTVSSSKEKASPLEKPVAKNHTPAPYIDNKTLFIKTQSMTDEKASKRKKELAKQMDLSYFLEESSFPREEKLVVLQLVEFLSRLDLSATAATSWEQQQLSLALESMTSCTILEFLSHMKHQSPGRVRHPVPYWNKAFLNFITQSAYELAAVG